MTAVYITLGAVGLLLICVGIVGLVAAVAEARHPLLPDVPVVPFTAPEDEQPTLGVRVEVARRALAEARERAAVPPARGSVRLLDPGRAGWLFAEREPVGVAARGWSQ